MSPTSCLAPSSTPCACLAVNNLLSFYCFIECVCEPNMNFPCIIYIVDILYVRRENVKSRNNLRVFRICLLVTLLFSLIYWSVTHRRFSKLINRAPNILTSIKLACTLHRLFFYTKYESRLDAMLRFEGNLKFLFTFRFRFIVCAQMWLVYSQISRKKTVSSLFILYFFRDDVGAGAAAVGSFFFFARRKCLSQQWQPSSLCTMNKLLVKVKV